jgi:SAM-dependent methyltransferase
MTIVDMKGVIKPNEIQAARLLCPSIAQRPNMTTSYDLVAYPSAVFMQTDPERLAVIAHLHGLSAPDPTTARVLEIGCGDGLNLLGFAAARPKATFHGFDLAASVIERGRALAEAAGLTNVTLEPMDILDAKSRFPAKSFDYVIAHGVYAWVPDNVREAVMALFGHVLSDEGIAFVSYNANPGGHVRMIMRDLLLHELTGITDINEKIETARAILKTLAEQDTEDNALKRTLADQARSMLTRPSHVLFHDELGACFYPQKFKDVVASAEANGLRFLSDAGRNRHLDGFLPGDQMTDANVEQEVVHRVQTSDYVDLRFFRHTLFVRQAQKPVRRIDVGKLDSLWCSSNMTRDEKGVFHSGDDEAEIADSAFADALEALTQQYPKRVPVPEVTDDPIAREAFLEMYAQWYTGLHIGPPPYAIAVPRYPRSSPLIRAQIAKGETRICTLAQKKIEIAQPELHRLILAADGTRSIEDLQADTTIGFTPDEIVGALAASAQRALICAD